MMPRQRCPFCQNTPRLEVERMLRLQNAALERLVADLQERLAVRRAPQVAAKTGEGTREERMFPVLAGSDTRDYRRLGMPREVPWRLLAPHEAQALRNHDQTLEKLASRGGLGPSEMRAIVEGKRWREVKMTPQQEFEWITAWLAQPTDAPTGAAPDPLCTCEHPRSQHMGFDGKADEPHACWAEHGNADACMQFEAAPSMVVLKCGENCYCKSCGDQRNWEGCGKKL